MTLSSAKMSLSNSNSPSSKDFKQGYPGKCGVLMGNVVGKSLKTRPVVVIAFSKRLKDITVGDYTVLFEPGPYMLYVPEGKYNIAAFEDVNNNDICEQDEFLGQYNTSEVISITAGQVIGELDFEIYKNREVRFSLSIDLKIPSHDSFILSSLDRGGTVSLDNKLFSKKYGSMGLWDASRFIETLGINIYALESFDSTKVPILFH